MTRSEFPAPPEGHSAPVPDEERHVDQLLRSFFANECPGDLPPLEVDNTDRELIVAVSSGAANNTSELAEPGAMRRRQWWGIGASVAAGLLVMLVLLADPNGSPTMPDPSPGLQNIPATAVSEPAPASPSEDNTEPERFTPDEADLLIPVLGDGSNDESEDDRPSESDPLLQDLEIELHNPDSP